MKKLEITIANQNLPEEVLKELVKMEKKINELKKVQDDYKAQLLNAMKENGVKKIETPDIVITYVDPTTRESFDSKRFKLENQDLYDQYINITNVTDSIRLKLK